MTDISVLPGCAFVLSHSLALSLSLSAASHPPCGLSCSQHSSLKEVTLLNDAGFQNRRSRNRQSRSPPRTGTVSLVLYSVVKQLNSLPRFRGEGKYTPSLDGGLARSHCRTARRIGDILAFVFGKYDLLYPGSHPGRTAINIL